MSEVYYSSRAFLNRADNYASESTIVCRITTTFAENADDISYLSGEVAFRDCSNRISLDLDASLPDSKGQQDMGYDNSVYKLDTLISELVNLRQAFMSAAVEMHKRAEEVKSKKEG